MAKIRRPTQFSRHHGISQEDFDATGALDPILNADTRLFIDPLLLKASDAPEMAQDAVAAVEEHYRKLVKLLSASRTPGDLSWRTAARMMVYKELPATCLGYGAATVRGSGFGKALSEKLMTTAAEIIELGIDDPELFLLLPLIEDGVGPDLISDMTTNIIAKALASYTQRICADLDVPVAEHDLLGTTHMLPTNAIVPELPVLLVPKDVLKKLPTASDWSEVASAAAKNRALRDRVNQHIGELFAMTTKRDKAALRERAVTDEQAAQTLLDVLRATKAEPYDVATDPQSRVALQRILREAAKAEVLDTDTPTEPKETVRALTQRFQHLVERKGLWRLLWKDKTSPHHERNAQLLYLAIADAYCQANDLDLTPEADTGSGLVDFKMSSGYHTRLLVEIKLSTNSKLVAGYSKQLSRYKEAEGAMYGLYVVVDVGRMGRKDKGLLAAKNEAAREGESVSEIIFVDGTRKKSASLL